jgi:hypothetical protein
VLFDARVAGPAAARTRAQRHDPLVEVDERVAIRVDP